MTCGARALNKVHIVVNAMFYIDRMAARCPTGIGGQRGIQRKEAPSMTYGTLIIVQMGVFVKYNFN